MRTLLIILMLVTRWLHAEGTPAPEAAPEVKEATVEEIREQYWAKGRQGSMGVVQNRNHPRKNRLELGVTGGVLLGDPYLSLKTAGASLGFHLSDTLSLHALYFKTQSGPSSAQQALLDQGTTANTNQPRDGLQTEARFDFAYGKLALTGTELVYLDAGFAFGVGRMLTETGGALLLSAGVGQHFHLGKTFAINLDYRVMTYKETIVGKTAATLGQNFPRTNVSHGITLGLSVFFDFSPSEPAAQAN